MDKEKDNEDHQRKLELRKKCKNEKTKCNQKIRLSRPKRSKRVNKPIYLFDIVHSRTKEKVVKKR
jgi:hypothetical protein